MSGPPEETPADFGATASQLLQLAARREHSLLSLMELSRELTVSLDLYAVADLTLFNLMGQIGTSRAALWMVSSESNGAVLVRSHGIRVNTARAIGAAFGLPLMDHLTRSGEPALVADLAGSLGPAPTRLTMEAGIALFAPVMTRARSYGVIALGGRVGGAAYTPLDLQVLQASAGLLGVALENTGLYNRLLESHRQLRVANNRMLELDRLKSEFLRNVNHELRTPLTVIMAYLDILMDGGVLEEQRATFLRTAADESQKLKALLEKLLDFSALSEDRFQANMIEGNPKDLSTTYYSERLPGVAEGLREFTFELADPLPVIHFDPHSVRVILDALVDNAVKFTPQGSHIRFKVDVRQVEGRQCVAFEVVDDGPGISAERLPHLFESFRQGDGSTTRKIGGMGIGLSLASKMAESMGGTLEAWSQPGKGTRLTLLLPVPAAGEASPARAA